VGADRIHSGVRKVFVEGDDDPVPVCGPFQNRSVGCAPEPDVSNVLDGPVGVECRERFTYLYWNILIQ
jgi:hypothetical protein